MSQITLASASNALKKRFSPTNLQQAGYKRHKMLGWLQKDTDWAGEALLHTVYHSGGRGKGTTIAKAQANLKPVAMARFTLERRRLYSVGTIEREFLKASRDQAMSLLNGRMALFKAKQYELMRDISGSLYGDGSGSRGTIAVAGIATDTPAAEQTTITLSHPAQAVHFEKGMRLAAAATPTGALRDSGALYEIMALNRIAGTLVVEAVAAPASPPVAWADGDHLFESGDAANGASDTLKIDGFNAWCPDADPVLGSDDFKGVDRGVDVSRLSGIRLDASASGSDDLEAIQDMGTLMQQEGAAPEVCFVNPRIAARVAKQLQGQVTYNDVKSTDARIFYRGFVVQTGAGDVTVLSDQDCPANKGWMLRKSAQRLVSLGEAPHLVDDDGLVLLRGASSDDFEVRFAMYGDLVVDEPQEVGNITFASVS